MLRHLSYWYWILNALFVIDSMADGTGAVRKSPSSTEGSKKAFFEKSPIIDEVEVFIGDPFVEVFIRGRVEKDCFSDREYSIEKKENETIIIPRFKTFDIDRKCESRLVDFREKAADLDPQSPSSRKIKVLSYLGWIEQFFDSDIQPVQK
jgi:hypothetical protein